MLLGKDELGILIWEIQKKNHCHWNILKRETMLVIFNSLFLPEHFIFFAQHTITYSLKGNCCLENDEGVFTKLY